MFIYTMKTSLLDCEDYPINEQAVREAQTDLIDGLSATRLAQIYAALADPTRVRIVSALNERELCVRDLAAVLGMTQSAISHQLRLMRTLGLVKNRKDGRIVFYTLEDEHIRDLFQRGLEHIAHGLMTF